MNDAMHKQPTFATKAYASKVKRVGLTNPHNICYVNSIIQATFVMKEKWAPSIKGSQLEMTWGAMATTTQTALGPKFGLDVRDSIPGYQDSLEQQDVQEALNRLFSTFDPTAILSHQHTYVTRTTCDSCGQTTTHMDAIRDVTIANHEANTQDAVFGDHDPEQLDEPVECDTCGQRQLATQTWQVDASAGTWLWVVVKLFDKEGKKLPSEVEISAVITKDENTFKLLAVISHTGATLARGHYVAYRSTPSGGFIRCDDREVGEEHPTFVSGPGETPYVAVYERTPSNGEAPPRSTQMGSMPVRRALDTTPKQVRRDNVHQLLASLAPDLVTCLQDLDPSACQLTKESRQWLMGETTEIIAALAVPAYLVSRVTYQLSRVRAAIKNESQPPHKTPVSAQSANARTLGDMEAAPRDAEAPPTKAPVRPPPAAPAHPEPSQLPPPTTQTGPELFSVRMARDGSFQGPPDDRATFRATVEMCRGVAPYTISPLCAERLISPRMLPAGQPSNRGTLLSGEVRNDANVFHWITVLRGRIDPIPGAPAHTLAALHLLGTSVNTRMIRIIAQGEVDAGRARRGVPEYVTHGELLTIIQETGFSELLSTSEQAALLAKPKKK